MLIAPPFGLLAHGRAMSKDCPHSQTSLLYGYVFEKSRAFLEKINFFTQFFAKCGKTWVHNKKLKI
jgi:hypothetical protein